MEHIEDYDLFESDDLDDLRGDLDSIGMDQIGFDVDFKDEFAETEDGERRIAIKWQGPDKETVTSIDGMVDTERTDIEIKLSDGVKIHMSSRYPIGAPNQRKFAEMTIFDKPNTLPRKVV